MKVYYRLSGLEKSEAAEKIHREIAAIYGVKETTIDTQKQELMICADAEMLPRIEHAAIVIISCITPLINVRKI